MIANKKPWGHECLAFQNEHVAIWHLFIDPWQETSLHCHPSKKTGLVVLEGGALVSFLSGQEKLFAVDKIMIRQGVFHKTTNRTKYPLQLLEIENPVNKDDLVRVQDKYSRPSNYGSEPKIEIQQEYNWNKSKQTYDTFQIGDSIVSLDNICVSDLYGYEGTFYDPDSIYMIVKGGIHHNGITVCGPGDVVTGCNLETLVDKFELSENSEAIRISRGY